MQDSDRSGIHADETHCRILPSAGRAQKQAAAQLAAGFLGFGFASAVVMFSSPPAACRLFRVEGVAGPARLREPRQVRAAGDDAHPRARRQPDGRVRARAAHLRADQRHAEARDRRLPVGRGQALLRARRARFHRHRRAPSTSSSTKIVSGSDRRTEGASTITQQVAKNFLLSSDRTMERKLKEAILAIRIERAYSKDKILELYLNEIYLGIGSYGVAAAALNYFNKELQRPRRSRRPPTWPRCRRRPTTTIRSAEREAAIDAAQLDHRPDGRERLHHRRGGRGRQGQAAQRQHPPAGAQIFAADYFAEEVRRTLLVDGLRRGRSSTNGGLSVRTTLDPQPAAQARKALIDGLVNFDRAQGLARAGDQDRHHRRLGRGAGDSRKRPATSQPWRLGVVLKVEPTKAVGRPAAGEAAGRQRSSTSARR